MIDISEILGMVGEEVFHAGSEEINFNNILRTTDARGVDES